MIFSPKARQQQNLYTDLTGQLITKLKTATHQDPVKLAYYRTHPAEWIIEHLGVRRETLYWSELPAYKKHVWDGDKDPLVKALNGLVTHRRIGVESGANTGKTIILVAGAALWFIACWEDASVVTAAPKGEQLKLHGWKEISRFWPLFVQLFPDAKQLDLQIRMRPENPKSWLITGFTAGVGADEQSATKAQGFHDEHQLIILEETPGIHTSITTAFDHTSSGDHNIILAVGNPDHQMDALHAICTQPGALHVRISALDHPNVVTGKSIIPAAVSRVSILDRKRRYGEASPLYQSRVRGISPAEASNALVRLAWCYAARDRNKPTGWSNETKALGIDVANSKAGDRGAIARGHCGVLGVCTEVDAFPCPDANELGGKVAIEMRTYNLLSQHVGVDIVGVGVGCYNELKRQGIHIVPLNGGSGMMEYIEHLFHPEERFANLRSQMWWLVRTDLEKGLLCLPDDEELYVDLVTPTWTTKGGKITVEAKEDIKKRLPDQRSPDKGDAFVYWNWVRQVAMSATTGGVMVNL